MTLSSIHPELWFTLSPASVDGVYGKVLFGFFVVLFLVGIVCRIVLIHSAKDRYMKMIGERLSAFFLSMGFVGMVLFFFSYEGIRFFGARFWYVLWFILGVVWTVSLVRFVSKEVPQKREQHLRQHAKSKYLPGRKK